MRFLITGGAGFIGSNLADFLLSKGYFVRVLDNFLTGKEKNLELALNQNKNKFELLKGDIRDRVIVEQACEDIDVVLHHAGLRSVPESFIITHEYNDVNIQGTVTILESARKMKVKRLVFASSSSVYGDNTQFPLSETHMPAPLSPYALNKLCVEYYCKIFSENSELSTVALRYFNVFGPKQAKDDEYSVVIPKFIQCIRDEKPTPIFGDGGQSRDFIYIDDVLSANFLAATVPGIKHEVINIASGKSHTILDLNKTLNKIFKKTIAPAFLPLRNGDIYKSEADISKAKKILGYHPSVSFEDGLAHTLKDFYS